MRVRPLKDLIQEADRYLGHQKSASSTGGTDALISSLAGSLLSASEVLQEGAVKVASGEASGPTSPELLMALNRLHADAQISELKKMASLRSEALKEGYTEEQVEEALEKIAAKRLHPKLPSLVGLEAAVSGGKDMNSLKKKLLPVRAVGENAKRRDATENMGE